MRIQRPRISQPVITSPTITQVTSLEGDGANITGSFSGSFDGTLTGPTSASFATRVAAQETFSSSLSTTFATDAELTTVSSSLASDVSTNATNHTTLSSSIATRVSTIEDDNATQTELDSVSSSLATRVSTIEDDNATQTELDAVSSSLASSITSANSDVTSLEGLVQGVRAYTGSLKTAITVDGADLTILGDLTVQGTQTSLDSATLNVADLNITVASGSTTAAAANGAGLTVDGANATLTYASTGDKWVFNKDLDLGSNNLTTSGNVDGVDVSTLKSDFDTLNGKTLVSGSSQVAIGSTTGTLAVNKGGTGATTAAAARTNLGVDAAGTDNSTDVTLVTTSHDYLSLSGQAITLGQIDISDDTNLAVSDTTGQTGINMTLSGDTISGTVSGLQTSSDVQFDSFGVGTAASGTTGEIRATNDITAYYSSDERLKENIVTLDGALDKVKAMRGVTFDWKELSEEERKTIHSHEGHDLGVIAQEVQAQYPELVHERDHGYLSVDYVKLTAVLIEAVKELSAKVDELSK